MRITQVDKDDKLVADLGPPVPEDAPARAATLDPPMPHLDASESAPTPPARTPPRPSLEVEQGVHAHLAPRLEAHLRRIESWDLRALPEGDRLALSGTISTIRLCFQELGTELGYLTKGGFVAKTTATGRKRAALRPGLAVKLRDDIHAKTVDLFHTAEELATLTVVKVGESSVMLITKEGREVGPLPLAHVVVA